MLPGIPLLSHPREVRPSFFCSALPAAPHFLGSRHSFLAPRTPLLPGCTLGCALEVRVAAVGREWPSVLGGTGRLLRPCGPGAGRAPWSPPRRGARPGNRQRLGAARPRARNRYRAGLCSHLASKIEPASEPGGRVRWRIAERNRQVGVYFQKRRGGAEGGWQVSARGVPVGGNLPTPGQLRQGQDLFSNCSL